METPSSMKLQDSSGDRRDPSRDANSIPAAGVSIPVMQLRSYMFARGRKLLDSSFVYPTLRAPVTNLDGIRFSQTSYTSILTKLKLQSVRTPCCA
jgi:hypothetical protein